MRTTTFSKITRLQVFYLDQKRLIKITKHRAMTKQNKVIALASSVVVRVPTPRMWETV